MQYWKKIIKVFNIGIIIIGLAIPLILFFNRFLIPDVSFDSLNYHLFLGFKGFNTENNKFEFYPTGIHSFSPILDMPGYVLMRVLGYRLGSVGSLIFLYLTILVIYKIFRLYQPKFRILDCWWWAFFFITSFLSYQAFLQISTYFIDIEVAFLTLCSAFWLLKYEQTKKLKHLIFSAVILAFLILGKMTAWYFLFPYFGYLLWVLVADKDLKWKYKISRLFLVGLVSVSLSLPFFWQNFKVTGNPIFPFYNNIFKSKYYSDNNFSQVIYGGKSLTEKLVWGIVSVKQLPRLDELAPLFHDYRINIFFVTSLMILIWALIKREKQMIRLVLFYLATYLSWSLVFGYIRYAIVLEFWGGLLLLLWLSKLDGLKKYVILIPLLFVMVVQDKRVVNLSLAYDLSFRPGYFYNRLSYPKELVNFNKNKIEIEKNLIDKYMPNVYLNCIAPNMSYYVLSDLNTLPVLNVEDRAYFGMTKNENYKNESYKRLKLSTGNEVRFVTIAGKEGLNKTYDDCINNLNENNFNILQEEDTNFLGFERQKLRVIFGEY